MHTRLEPGKFSRALGCGGMNRPLLESCRYWVERVGMLGSSCQRWAQAAVDARGPEAIRSLMGLWGLRKAHAAAALNQACQSAMASGTRRLKDIKRLLASPGERQMTFQESHPLIRDLGVYGEFITNTHHANHTQIPRAETAALGAA